MASQVPSRWSYSFDYWKSMISLFIGRLLPTLHVETTELTGKNAIITGANSGIGLQIAHELAKRGASVYLACRNRSKGEDAASSIVAAVPGSSNRIKVVALDTSSLTSVRDCASHWASLKTPIDILVHNAGIADPSGRPYTAEGFPMLYATNLLGSFLLTNLLEPHLKNSARVIFTASHGQYASAISSDFALSPTKERFEPGFHAPKAAGVNATNSAAYANSKSMQVAFAKLLQQRWDRIARESGKPRHLTAHSFSPGFTYTPIFDKQQMKPFRDDPVFWMIKLLADTLATTVDQGAATGVWLATTVADEVMGAGNAGHYWDRMSKRVSSADMLSQAVLDRLWIRWEADAGIQWR